jgi:uncharacterized surface protein with fasciclin (FAS1) repeats
MKKIIRNSIFALSLVSLGFATGCKSDDDNGSNGNGQADQTVSGVISERSEFSIFAEVVAEAELESELDNENNIMTCFAPDDDAFVEYFHEMGVSTAAELKAQIGADAMVQLVHNHILETSKKASAFVTGYIETKAKNDRGNNLSLYVDAAGTIKLNGSSTVIEADINAKNGIVHKVDVVIAPPSKEDLVKCNETEFSSYIEVMASADASVGAMLSDPEGESTLCIPDNAAFNAALTLIGATNIPDLISFFGQADLTTVLKYHIIGSDMRAEDFSAGSLNTEAQQTVDVSINSSGEVVLTGFDGRPSTMKVQNITAVNGSVHIMSDVLMPDLD